MVRGATASHLSSRSLHQDSDLIYATKEHPELAHKDDQVIYATFVNSATYVPELIEITLKKS